MTEITSRLSTALADHYRIERRLGEGGMATVYLAEDLKHERKVALKVLKPELAAVLGTDRFLREIRVAAHLNHPHILPLFDSGKVAVPPLQSADSGSGGEVFLYYVMPFVEGPSLADRIRDGGPLGIDEIRALVTDLASALDYAHGAGIVHRDIKPDNVMLHHGKPMIADFGIALAVSQVGGERLTETGLSIGTPQYMSPEQVSGDAAVDARSDVYALGCVVYEMVVGDPPFTGRTALAVMARQVADPAPPIRTVRRDVPASVETAVTKALAKVPGDRFASAGDFVAALTTTSAEKRASSSIESLAVLPLANLSDDPAQEYFAFGMTEQLITELTKIGALTVISRTSVMRYKDSDKPLGQIARELGVDAVVEGSALKAGDRVRINAQLIEAATDRHMWAEAYERDLHDVLALQPEVASAIAREVRLTLTPMERVRLGDTTTVDPAAHDDYLKGRYYWSKWTEEGFDKALRYFDQAIARDSQYAPAHAARANVFGTLGYFGVLPPHTAFPQSKDAAVKALDIDETVTEAHLALGMAALLYDWDFTGANRELERAIELDPGSGLAHQGFAFYQLVAGDDERAIAEMSRALELDPLSLVINSDMGWVLFFARRYGGASQQAQVALELDPNFSSAHWLLGRTYALQGSFDDAIATLETAAALSGRSPLVIGSLGEVYGKVGRDDEARRVLDELLQMSAQRYVSPVAVAAVYIGLGEKDRAFEWIGRATDERDGPIVYCNVESLFDVLRGDPRFDAITRRIGAVEPGVEPKTG